MIDYIPNGLVLNDANWTQLGANAVTTIAGLLAATASTTVDIKLSIYPSLTANTYINYAEIARAEDIFGNPGFDIDSTPDTNNEENLND